MTIIIYKYLCKTFILHLYKLFILHYLLCIIFVQHTEDI